MSNNEKKRKKLSMKKKKNKQTMGKSICSFYSLEKIIKLLT
jgi:hypothetical protein